MRSLKSCLSLGFVLLILCSFAACSKKAQSPEEIAAQNEIIARLEQTAANDPIAIQSIISEYKADPVKMNNIGKWLHAKIINHDPQSLYTLYLSDIFLSMAKTFKDRNDPAFAIMNFGLSYQLLKYFELAGSIDAIRCEDPSVLPAIEVAIKSRAAAFPVQDTTEGKRISSTLRTEAVKSAFAYESEIADRGPNASLCMLGAQAREARLNGTTYTPRFIPDNQWKQKRLEIVQKFKAENLN